MSMHSLSIILTLLVQKQGLPVDSFKITDQLSTVVGKSIKVSAIIEELKKVSADKFVLFEQVPSIAAIELNAQNVSQSELLGLVSGKSSIKVSYLDGGKVGIAWGEGAIPEGQVRIFREQGIERISVSKCPVGDLGTAIKAFYNDPALDFSPSLSTQMLSGFSIASKRNESKADFFGRVKNKVTSMLAAANAPAPDNSPAVWTLTYLGSEPPQLGSASKINFRDLAGNQNLDTIVNGLNSAFKYKEGEVEKLPISRIGNSLLINGPSKQFLLNFIATRVDIPQSEVQLQVTSYVSSSNARSERGNKELISKLLNGQEIAKMYRRAHLRAISALVDLNREEIVKEMENQKAGSVGGGVVYKFYQKLGFDPKSALKPSFAELLMFLAYMPQGSVSGGKLKSAINKSYSETYEQIRLRIQSQLISNPNLVGYCRDLDELNDLIAQKLRRSEGRLPTHAGGSRRDTSTNSEAEKSQECLLMNENYQTRLELSIDKPLVAQETQIENNATREAILRFLYARNRSSFSSLTRDTALGDESLKNRKKGSTAKDGMGNQQSLAVNLAVALGAESDTPNALLRSGLAVDDILAIATNAIEGDMIDLIDSKFDGWASRMQKGPTGTDWGVRNLGTTTITATSRSAAFAGATTTSFFPSQPSVDTDLGSLVGLLKRTDAATPQPEKTKETTSTVTSNSTVDEKGVQKTTLSNVTKEETKIKENSGGTGSSDIASKLGAVGLTSPEILILNSLFENAKLSPFYKEIGAGLTIGFSPVMMPTGTEAKLQIRLKYAIDPKENQGGAGSKRDRPAPVNFVNDITTETELYVNALDLATVTNMNLLATAPSKRDWEFFLAPILSPLKSWFVGPTVDQTIRHEAIVMLRVKITPKAMDLASRIL